MTIQRFKIRLILSLLFSLLLFNSSNFAQDKYAVLVGVESYDPSKLGQLRFAEDDAIALGESLKELEFQVKVMTGQAHISTAKPTTPEKILRILATQMNNCIKGDTIVISLSGHGLQFGDEEPLENGARETYFCPEDADPSDRDTLLPISEVEELMKQCEASRKLLLIDACRNEFDDTEGAAKSARKLKLESVHESRKTVPGGMVVMFSCAPKQFSFEHEDIGHSVFTYHIVKYLSGNAESRFYDEDGSLNLNGLTNYVSKRTNEYVSENNLSADGQVPTVISASNDWKLGSGTNPVRALLQKMVEYSGGKGRLKNIDQLIITRSYRTMAGGEAFNFSSIDYAKPGLVITDTLMNGGRFRQGMTPDFGWVTELDNTVRPMDEREHDASWTTAFPYGVLELSERYDECEIEGKTTVNGNEAFIVRFGESDEGYYKMFITEQGEYLGSESLSRGQTTKSIITKNEEINGYTLATEATISIENDTFSTRGTVTADYEFDARISSDIFRIPSNVPRNPKVDIARIVNEYNDYSQVYVAESEGTLSQVEFRKISSNTMAVDLYLARGVYENTDPSFWSTAARKPAFIQLDLEENDRAMVKSGVVLQVTYKKPDGTSASQFYITQNDF